MLKSILPHALPCNLLIVNARRVGEIAQQILLQIGTSDSRWYLK